MTLFVLNPNSSETVTAGIDRAIAPLRAWGTPIRCLTLAEGPPGIESQLQSDLTVAPMLSLAARQEDGHVLRVLGQAVGNQVGQ